MQSPVTKQPRPKAPPPLRLRTVRQTEERHPGLEGRLRAWICRADAGDPEYSWMREAIVRVGRSVFIDELSFDYWLIKQAGKPPAPSRREEAAA